LPYAFPAGVAFLLAFAGALPRCLRYAELDLDGFPDEFRDALLTFFVGVDPHAGRLLLLADQHAALGGL
jgi:hypothetical protein